MIWLRACIFVVPVCDLLRRKAYQSPRLVNLWSQFLII